MNPSSLDPYITYAGSWERIESIHESCVVFQDFEAIVEEQFPDRTIWGAVWSRQDAIDYGIAKPFGKAASSVLASNIPTEEFEDFDGEEI